MSTNKLNPVTPTMIAKNISDDGLGALHEIHIFLNPLNPTEENLQQYYAAVNEWNNNNPTMMQMKACYLCLVFNINGVDTDVCVMQSARYYRDNDTEKVINQCKADCVFFESRGLSVLREKIEANAHSINGIPISQDDTKEFPLNYFEFHIKVQRKNKAGNRYSKPISDSELAQLKLVSKYLTHVYQRPVPLSYNKNKDKVQQDNEGHQRFFNVRFRNVGLDTIKTNLTIIKNIINTTTDFEVVKSIDEYVWYDTNPKVDHGWIDFEPDTEQEILNNLISYFTVNKFE